MAIGILALLLMGHIVGALAKLIMPGGKSPKLPASSFLNSVHRYLTDATATQRRKFTFDCIDFDAATRETSGGISVARSSRPWAQC